MFTENSPLCGNSRFLHAKAALALYFTGLEPIFRGRSMIEELRMAELLCTRLCHDLTGPIGAVNNGAEFLSEEGFNMQNQAVDLIVSSAFSAVSRLQFYRMAYGRVKDHGEASLADKKKMTEDYFAGTKIVLDWPDEYTDAAGVSISLKMVRLIFNLMILASGALLRGGTVSVKIAPGEAGEKRIEVRAFGPAVKWEAESSAILNTSVDAQEQMTPKNVQLYLTRRLGDELGVRLTIDAGTESLAFTAVQPATETAAA